MDKNTEQNRTHRSVVYCGKATYSGFSDSIFYLSYRRILQIHQMGAQYMFERIFYAVKYVLLNVKKKEYNFFYREEENHKGIIHILDRPKQGGVCMFNFFPKQKEKNISINARWILVCWICFAYERDRDFQLKMNLAAV